MKSNAADKCVISVEDTDKECTSFNSTPASDMSHGNLKLPYWCTIERGRAIAFITYLMHLQYNWYAIKVL